MLCKLAFSNLRRSFGNYWAYFLSAAFSAFVLYLFLSVVYGEATASATEYQSTQTVFGIGAVLTGLFTVFFLWYSNSFFVKMRKKEFATYMLLGMSRGQTIRLCLMENFAILALAYAAGITAGILLNKLLIMALLAIIHIKVQVPFEINRPALMICTGVYAGVLGLISLHSAWLILRSTLLDLMNASRRSEKLLRVTPGICLLGLLALLCLGLGYGMSVFGPVNPVYWLPMVLLVCTGTALLFLSLGALYFHFARRNRSRLLRGSRLVTVSQLMHRYRGNVGVLTVIAITTTVALCAVMSCFSLFTKVEENSRAMRPFSVEYVKTAETDSIFDEVLARHSEARVTRSLTLGLILFESASDEENSRYYYLMGQSYYNEAMAALGRSERADLQENGACLLISYGRTNQNPAAVTLPAQNRSFTFTVTGTDEVLFMSLDRFRPTLVVRDGAYEAVLEASGGSEIRIAEVMVAGDTMLADFTADLQRSIPQEGKLMTLYDHYMDSLGLMGVMVFVGVFVGLLFVVATGGILYFRMAMEAHEDRDKYALLLKLGMSPDSLRGAVARQLGIIFGAPLLVAAANAFAALFQLERMINTMNSMKTTFVFIVAMYALCYGAYYLIALRRYVSTVTGRV